MEVVPAPCAFPCTRGVLKAFALLRTQRSSALADITRKARALPQPTLQMEEKVSGCDFRESFAKKKNLFRELNTYLSRQTPQKRLKVISYKTLSRTFFDNHHIYKPKQYSWSTWNLTA